MPGIIRTYNVAVGGVNDDHGGYHETITQAYLAAIRAFAATLPAGSATEKASPAAGHADGRQGLAADLLVARAALFSVAARRGWVEPKT